MCCCEVAVLLKLCWTRVAQVYPKKLCSMIATALAKSTDLCSALPSRRKLDGAGCARSLSRRVGEASHPGPRVQPWRSRPASQLLDVNSLKLELERSKAELGNPLSGGFNSRRKSTSTWSTESASPDVEAPAKATEPSHKVHPEQSCQAARINPIRHQGQSKLGHQGRRMGWSF